MRGGKFQVNIYMVLPSTCIKFKTKLFRDINVKKSKRTINTKFKVVVSSRRQAEESEQDEHARTSGVFLKLVGGFIGVVYYSNFTYIRLVQK